jgi:hypothetical protein
MSQFEEAVGGMTVKAIVAGMKFLVLERADSLLGLKRRHWLY